MKAPVSKTGMGVSLSRVRIPASPLYFCKWLFFKQLPPHSLELWQICAKYLGNSRALKRTAMAEPTVNLRHATRNYKPIGFTMLDRVEYESYPIEVRFAHLTSKTIQSLSVHGDPDPGCIFLYDDGSIPCDEEQQNLETYFARLSILLNLQST